MNSDIDLETNIIDQKIFSYLFEDNKFNASIKIKNDKKLIQSICLLSFDDSIGQIADIVWPENSLDKQTIKQVTGSGFPETNMIAENGENKFIFKIRKSIQKFYLDYNIPLMNTSISDQEFYYCYTLFIQKKDKQFSRGYMQKSLVIVSEYYLKNLFYHFLTEIRAVIYTEENAINTNILEVIFDIIFVEYLFST
jgi:hypothetical protein